ncbi:putative Ig domain-containing protein [Leifsonia sp. ZF2019]|uniref:putative Ig domain-containing protein n=1 Tax=Leifsonia sp. ZF2019 TaxID=2781978 RepID=UPI001CBD2731|nr:putative Ig domain-containing protein [Leifsonia sp. ZF2019]UAJ78883.1 putative Ig domain-containing protein [Leifsonia sp. ZF2019]
MNRTRIIQKRRGLLVVAASVAVALASAALTASAATAADAATTHAAASTPAYPTYYTGYSDAVGIGGAPIDVAFDASGQKAYAVNEYEVSVSVVDTSTKTAVDKIWGFPSVPLSIAVDPHQKVAYVGMQAGVAIVDLTSDTVTGTIAGYTGANATSVVFTPDGSKALVTNSISNSVSIIDTASAKQIGVVSGFTGVTPKHVALSRDGRTAYVTDSGSNAISIIDVASGAQTGTISGFTGAAPEGIAVSPDGTIAYVTNMGSASISVLDLATGSQSGTVAGFTAADSYGATFSPDGRSVLVTTGGPGRYGIVLQIDVATATEIGAVGTLDSDRMYYGASPSGIAFQPGTDTAYVADFDSDDVKLVYPSSAPAFDQDAPPLTATTGTPFDYTFVAAGTPAFDPMGYGVTGTLPPGLGLNPGTGAVSGTPTTAGSWTFAITAYNTTGTTSGATHEITVEEAAAPAITSADHLTGQDGDAIDPFTITATGAPAPTLSTPTLTSADEPSTDPSSQLLPDGLSFDAATGKLTGTIAAGVTPGDYSFDVTATNGTNPSATQRFTVHVVPAAAASSPAAAPGADSPAPATDSPTGHAAQDQESGVLAHTGSDLVGAGIAAALILLGGLVLLLIARRRRRAAHR